VSKSDTNVIFLTQAVNHSFSLIIIVVYIKNTGPHISVLIPYKNKK